MSAITKATENVAAEFDPNKEYQWKPIDRFSLSGKELEMFHNTLGQIFMGELPDAQMYVRLNYMLEVTTNIIKQGVENGIIKEA